MGCQTVSQLVGRVGLFCYLYLSSACSASPTIESKLINGYTYNSPLILGDFFSGCEERSLDLDSLFKQLKTNVKQDMEKREISDTFETLSFEKASFYGVKRTDDIFYVEYVFDKLKDPSVRLVGEGGVSVIVDVCSQLVVQSFIWRGY